MLRQPLLLAQPGANDAARVPRLRRRIVTPRGVEDADGGRARDEAIHRVDEVARPATASKLAVAEDVHANLFLELEDLQNGAVLDRAQLVQRQLALGVSGVRVLDNLGSEEAADLVGAIGGAHAVGGVWHTRPRIQGGTIAPAGGREHDGRHIFIRGADDSPASPRTRPCCGGCTARCA